jgi:hypothetical protein
MPVTSTSRIAEADIDRAEAVSIADIGRERGLVLKKVGGELVGPCPRCGGGVDRFAINVAKNLFNCRACSVGGRGAIAFTRWLHGGCTFPVAVEIILTGGRAHQVVRGSPGLPGTRTAPRTPDDHDRRRREKARWLWSHRRPITGSIAEAYLREVRGIACPLPPTLAFLPPSRPGHHPALISAFAFPDEVEPGMIAAPRIVSAVHLTLLRADGSGKADVEKNKIMIGSPSGTPIVIAPPTDLLALAITEGIEDALSAHEATGLGAWAAGSAPHMGKLGDAVPSFIDAVTIFADDDADHQGERNAMRLADRLNAGGIEATIEGLGA